MAENTRALAVDAERVGRLLLKIEVGLHAGGWDGPPGLFVLYDEGDPETALDARCFRRSIAEPSPSVYRPAVRCGPYAAQEMVPSALLSPNAAHVLFSLAVAVSGTPDPEVNSMAKTVTGMFRWPGVHGVALAYEAWARSGPDKAVLDADNARGFFADMPGSFEARMVNAALVDGGQVMVFRKRGEAPSVQSRAAGEPAEFEGAIGQSLAVLAAAVSGRPLPELDTYPKGWPAP